MRRIFITIFLTLAITSFVMGQSEIVAERITENIEMRIPASEFTPETFFHLKNINGDLNAEGYDGDEIVITGTKIITGKPNVRGSFDPDEFYLDRLDGKRNIYVFVRHPGMEVELKGDELIYRSTNKKNEWYDRVQEFEFNLQIKIPRYLMSEISTINAGQVVVEGMTNGVEAKNINGNVLVTNVEGPITAHTVNGNIRAEFGDKLFEEADLHTVNGNIEVIAPKSFSAVVTFKSLHGDLYTDFEEIEHLTNRTKRKKDGMNRFSIGVSDAVQFGEGGPELRMQLLNGNAYIKQRKS